MNIEKATHLALEALAVTTGTPNRRALAGISQDGFGKDLLSGYRQHLAPPSHCWQPRRIYGTVVQSLLIFPLTAISQLWAETTTLKQLQQSMYIV